MGQQQPKRRGRQGLSAASSFIAPPASASTLPVPSSSPAASLPYVDQLGQLSAQQQHDHMMSMYRRRIDQSKRIIELWSRGNVSGIVGCLQMPKDTAVFCSFLRQLLARNLHGPLSLDACQILLPLLRDIMSSKYDEFVGTALSFTEVLFEKFRGLIADTRRGCAKIPERQLDLAQEERLKKCNFCYDRFQEVHGLPFETLRAGRDFKSTLQAFLQSC